MIAPERVRDLNRAGERPGRFVLYWMQQSQRAEDNPALEHAVSLANERRLPVVALFCLCAFPEATLRHYVFMLQGLAETARHLERRGIPLLVLRRRPDEGVPEIAQDAALMVADAGYLRVQKQWRRAVARAVLCRVVHVEADAVVPVETASVKEEYSAATLRRRIRPLLARFLVPPEPPLPVRRDGLGLRLDHGARVRLSDEAAFRGALRGLRLDRSVPPTDHFIGGASEAERRLDAFLAGGLRDYADAARDPARDAVSHLSPYLHFGQISALRVAARVEGAAGASAAAKEAFLEQIIVRRELAMNFVFYNPRYDTFGALPPWARNTLRAHAADRREYLYSPADLEGARTHDPYWNAAQRQLLLAGWMHNTLRMYWGKKILEWSPTPEEAFRAALYLNNKYLLDGRDPNGFAGVAWCFGKHDRPWAERPVFGTVRYMNANGLRRKYDMDAVLRRVEALTEHG